MAYAALISLKQTIHPLLYESPQISIVSFARRSLESAYKEIKILQEILQKLQSIISDSSISERRIATTEAAINTVNGQIIEALWELEDAIESYFSNQFLIAPSEEISIGVKLLLMLVSFVKRVKKMEGKYVNIIEELESRNPLPEEDAAVAYGVNESTNMVGLSDVYNNIKDELITHKWPFQKEHIALAGMAGIGKTTLMRKIVEDPSVQSCFEYCAFVTVGPKYQPEEIIQAILDPKGRGTYQVPRYKRYSLQILLEQYLHGKKYLIVLDDVWDKKFLESFISPYLSDHALKRSRVVVTTRIKEVAKYVTTTSSNVHQMRFLNKKESLHLLREKVFGQHDQTFPDQKAAEKIAENCEGLPLAIIAVADLLSKDENKKKPEYWREVAEKGSLVFGDVGDGMRKVLILSYNYLPQHLKPCFLYMAVFPPNCKIAASKLISLWSVEGFLEVNPQQDLEGFSKECLENLAFKSDLVLVGQQRSNNSGVRICTLHPVYWYLCNIEAVKEKFLHVVNGHVDSFTQGIERQRRLCIYNNVLFGIEKVRESMESNISMARSLLCTGPHHQYPLPRICFGSRLLKVLDALTIRFYNFPIEVVELVQLKYLALTYSGKIPASISKLWKLEYLIVHQRLSDDQHLSIIPSGARSCLPIEIWNMQKLRCLQVMGSDLIIPPDGDSSALLSNLLTLSYTSANSCTKEIFKRTPNLKKLGVQIELSPDDDHLLRCFDYKLAFHLHQLESLKCVVVNPKPRSGLITFPYYLPPNIKKLSLSGLGCPWENMDIVTRLWNLQVLKLRHYAFQGPSWEVSAFEFPKLQYLLLEDTDLEYLQFVHFNKGHLTRHIVIRHCYNLKTISNDFSYAHQRIKLELVDCPSALASVKETQEKCVRNKYVEVSVRSSWDEGKPKSTLL